MTEFDDYNDREDWNEKRKQFESFERDAQRFQAEKIQEQERKQDEKTVSEMLKELNLTPEQWVVVDNLDIEFRNKNRANHIKSYMKTSATRARDPRTGQYVSGSPKPKAPHSEVARTGQPAPSEARPQEGFMEKYQQKAKNGTLSDHDRVDMLDAKIGRLLD